MLLPLEREKDHVSNWFRCLLWELIRLSLSFSLKGDSIYSRRCFEILGQASRSPQGLSVLIWFSRLLDQTWSILEGQIGNLHRCLGSQPGQEFFATVIRNLVLLFSHHLEKHFNHFNVNYAVTNVDSFGSHAYRTFSGLKTSISLYLRSKVICLLHP